MKIPEIPHGPRAASQSRIVGWVGLGGRVLVVCVVMIAVTEWVLARQRPDTIAVNNEPYPYVMFQPPGGATWRSEEPSPGSRTGEHAVEYTSPEGFRIEAPGYGLSRSKPDEQVRVAMVGGSTVRIGTSFGVSLAGALRARLRRDFPDVDLEVINAGIISAVARQELMLLVNTIVDFEPDILVVYDGINDSGQMLYYEDRPHFPFNYRVVEAAWRQYVEGRSEPLWRLATQRSAILERILPDRFGDRSVLSPVPAERLLDDPDLVNMYAGAHTEDWEKMWRVATAYGIRAIFVLQPTSLYPEVAAGRLDARSVPWLYANFLIYEEMRRSTQAFAARRDVRHLDLSDMLPTEAFYDGAHVYDDVNAQIAERIADFIIDDVLAVLEDRNRSTGR